MPEKPADLARLRWVSEVEGHLRFLEKLPTVQPPIGAGERWRQGMRTYYIRKVKALLSAAPSGSESDVKAYTRRLSRV